VRSRNARERGGVLQDTPRSNPDEKFQRTMEDGPDACLAVARQRGLIAMPVDCIQKLASRR
jgi:hypothetical protein